MHTNVTFQSRENCDCRHFGFELSRLRIERSSKENAGNLRHGGELCTLTITSSKGRVPRSSFQGEDRLVAWHGRLLGGRLWRDRQDCGSLSHFILTGICHSARDVTQTVEQRGTRN